MRGITVGRSITPSIKAKTQALHRLMAIVLLVLSVVGLFGCGSRQSGSTDKQTLIKETLEAIKAGNAPALIALVHPDYDGKSEIDHLIDKYAGGRFVALRISIKTNSVADFLAEASVKGKLKKTGVSRPFSLKLHMERVNDSWFLVIGNRTQGGQPKPPAAGTTRTH